MKADNAAVAWDAEKRAWRVRIQIGAEVIKRPAGRIPRDAADETLRSAAVETAQGDGYELDPASVTIAR